uniref:RGS domain-containing protein n=1 Tax=Panagrolaimus sp. JU765 TaxID=591449 RepID=A0AC34QFD4_9BILA
MPYLCLQNCEPGWGYDCRTGLIISISDVGYLRTTPYKKRFDYYYEQKPFHLDWFLNYDDIGYWIINENPNVYIFMEFYFANYQNCEFAFKFRCLTKLITAEKSDNYPPEATHFVEDVTYGKEMWIFFDRKYSSLFDSNGRNKFLEKVWKGEQKLTKEQENVECSVLIFANNFKKTTVKQMKLSQVLQFCDDIKNEKYPEYETILWSKVTELPERISVFNEKFRERMTIFGKKCFKSFEFLRNPKNKNLTEKEQQTDDIVGDEVQMDSQTIIMDKNSLSFIEPKILQRLKTKIVFLNNKQVHLDLQLIGKNLDKKQLIRQKYLSAHAHKSAPTMIDNGFV